MHYGLKVDSQLIFDLEKAPETLLDVKKWPESRVKGFPFHSSGWTRVGSCVFPTIPTSFVRFKNAFLYGLL